MANPTSGCKICLNPQRAEIEAMCLEAIAETKSWRSVFMAFELTGNPASLKNHMDKHYAPVVDVVMSDFDDLVAECIVGLKELLAAAPPELKPLYLTAIKNTMGIARTQPSQQNLINSLKVIQEVAGMKQEQRFLLEYSKHAFPQPVAALEEMDEAEVVQEEPNMHFDNAREALAGGDVAVAAHLLGVPDALVSRVAGDK